VRHLVLVGLMGSGKTSVGRLVAARLGWPLRDSDADIEAGHGASARELRDRLDTEALHAIEADHLLDALALPGPTVICAAASTIDDDACLRALGDPALLVAWLTASPETAAARFDDQVHRPRFGDDPAVFLASQGARRDERFRALAPAELATDGRTPEELAAVVLALVTGRVAGR
jgi:shikimate kinase